MGKNSAISWTDHTFNPWWGCVKVSPACDNCYAEGFDRRVGGDNWGTDKPRRFFTDKHWNEPLKWNARALADFGRPARVFCASMADVFEDRAELQKHRERLFALIEKTPNLRWNLLTKRHLAVKSNWERLKHLSNVRIGVTVENQAYDHRIVEGVSWISAEPLLGPLNLHIRGSLCTCSSHQFVPCRGASSLGEYWICERRLDQINWVIIGGESGAHAREMKLEWAIEVINRCKAAGVAVHFKQTGDVLARKLGLKDKSGKDPSEWPSELRIQEFPKLELAA